MDNFIHRAYLSDLTVCDELIQMFTLSNDKGPGQIIGGVNNSVKASTDLTFSSREIKHWPPLVKYFSLLQRICNEYIELYPTCNAYAPWSIENFNIQHYAPNEGFFSWHCERTNSKRPFTNRHLVWMTYLNDVQDAGGTEFLHQKEVVQPRKGLTLIWPVDWTYTHRGIPSPTEHKYIITGWYDYV
jgi:hypothetical protein